jgi:NADH-quinone oxidoreductase subunit G
MPTFKLDGKEIPFAPGETIITAAWKEGIEIPHYCWHPGLSVAANCRMCLVEIMPAPNQRPVMLDVLEWDAAAGEYKPQRKPKLQPACQMMAADGMEVRSDTSEHVRKARHDVQEFLLLQHPVDCPICDQAGECKLQDYWLEHGQYSKRMRDEPVHKPKGVSFGPTIVYDAERCVVCTRCIRFMAEVAKDPVLDQRERGNVKEIIVAPGRQLEGNYTFMVDHVCPVGALTTKDFRFKARVWFLRGAKSVCQGCATGCSAWLDFDPRRNQAERYRPRENPEVNKFWMCDHGMTSYRGAHEARVVDARVGGKPASLAKALEKTKKLFDGVPHASIAIVLSAQASLEDNWAMIELGKSLFGADSFFVARAPDGDHDDILLSADKNSNVAGIKALMPEAKSWADFLAGIESGSVRHAIALGARTGDLENEKPKLAKLEALVTVASHESALTAAAAVVLPATSWAEQTGIYVNAKGIKQIAEKALEPQGISRSAFLQVAEIAETLGHEPTWTKLKDVRAKLAALDLLPASGPEPHPQPAVLPTTATQAV